MTGVVAVHQPNYLPWLGYFHKIASADAFVFLDDVQFSKNGFTNRVRVMSPAGPKWLTVPVSVHLGQPINEIEPARAGWAEEHRNVVHDYYRDSPEFASVWNDVEVWFEEACAGGLAAVNRRLVEHVADRLGLRCTFLASSELEVPRASGDDRLVAIVDRVAPGGVYLSGAGARNYQDPAKFDSAGLTLRYADFRHPVYPQSGGGFTSGLSVVDAAFHIGWEGVAKLLWDGARD